MSADIGVSEADRKGIAEALARLLADTHTMYLKTHQYHWNVVGPRFPQLHSMFEDQYRELWEATDEIAERIRTLGFWAPGTYAELGRLRSVTDEEGVPDAETMVRNLLEGHETVLRTAGDALELAEQARDAGTVDLVTRRIAAHQKTSWMLAATA